MIHSSLRSLNFWRVILINFLVSTFIYMLMPLWPSLLDSTGQAAYQESGLTMMVFCLGLFVPGCVSSYLLDRYRRKMVCFWSIIVLAVVSLLATLSLPIWVVGLCRFVQGVAFALFHIALGSTILIDITISERRDVAAYIYFWICRFSLGVGPALGIIALQPYYWEYLKYLPLVCAVLAIYFIIRLDVPFRSPLRSNVFSMDRFWLRHTTPLVMLLFPVVFCVGMEMAINLNPLFFVYLLIGLVLSILFHFMVFYRADMRAEIVTGLVALVAAFLLLLTQDDVDVSHVAAGLSGYGLGNVTGRLLSFFTVASKHTERGSAQGTYKLTFESALCLGFFLPCVLPVENVTWIYLIALCLSALCLPYYLLFVHSWFTKHIKR